MGISLLGILSLFKCQIPFLPPILLNGWMVDRLEMLDGWENSLLEQLITSGNRDHAFLRSGCGGGNLSAREWKGEKIKKEKMRKAEGMLWSQSWHGEREKKGGAAFVFFLGILSCLLLLPLSV
ncbi:hypothetical protein HOY82DRAFT_573556 [Tuber indicum]|nr:hypothetical protein HOY82DRAFT_573556 [Tuber indicum]